MAGRDYIQNLIDLFAEGIPEKGPFGTEVLGLIIAASGRERERSLIEDGLGLLPQGESRPWQMPDEEILKNEGPIRNRWKDRDFVEAPLHLYGPRLHLPITEVREEDGDLVFICCGFRDAPKEYIRMPRAHIRRYFILGREITRLVDISSVEHGPFGPSAKNWAVIHHEGDMGFGPKTLPIHFAMMTHYGRYVNSLGRSNRRQMVGI